MSTNSQDQEIDLGQLFQGLKKFLNILITPVLNFFSFILNNRIVVVILFILGVSLAFLIDKKEYKHEISVIPNFGSNEYLYQKINQLDTKLREGDTLFFNSIGVKNAKSIQKIEIEAFPAIYNFVNNKDQALNFEFLKLLAEDGDLEKIMKDDITSRNYYHHKITITTQGTIHKEALILPIVSYLCDNDYFKTQQKIYVQNLSEKLAVNDSIINQIDKVIVSLSKQNNIASNVSISDNNGIPSLIEKKDKLISENQYLKRNLPIYDSIIKEESSIINVRKYKPLYLNNKILFPILLILFYYFIVMIYKKK